MADFAAPNLPSRDFDVTVAFYSAFGFEVSHRDEGWLIMRRGDVQLEFFPVAALVPEESSFMCCVRVDDVDALVEQIEAARVPLATTGAPRLHPVRMQPWGRRAGFLIDPDGTQLSLIGDGISSHDEASVKGEEH